MSSGKELGADIFGLWRAGTRNLPDVATVYAEASTACDIEPTQAFARAGDLGFGPHGPWSSWQTLNDELSSLLVETSRNLRDTGRALVAAADDFAATDTTARAEFDRLRGRTP